MKISFIPSSLEVELFLQNPKPSKNYIPEWYKNIKAEKDFSFDENNNLTNLNVKACMPFFDALSHGYIQETWQDIYVENNEDGFINYRVAFPHVFPSLMSYREKPTPIDHEKFHEKNEFTWNVQWIPKLPDGWSILITQPLNHFNLPFTTTSGIIDADKFFHVTSGALPFYFKKGFSGLIPAGTPMYQMIPIKREFWNSEAIKFDEITKMQNNAKFSNSFMKAYKNKFWQKKFFN